LKAFVGHARFCVRPQGSPATISDLAFLEQYGTVLNLRDLAQRDELFENWSHLNHAGAMTASARLADAIAGLDF